MTVSWKIDGSWSRNSFFIKMKIGFKVRRLLELLSLECLALFEKVESLFLIVPDLRTDVEPKLKIPQIHEQL